MGVGLAKIIATTTIIQTATTTTNNPKPTPPAVHSTWSNFMVSHYHHIPTKTTIIFTSTISMTNAHKSRHFLSRTYKTLYYHKGLL